MPIITLLTDFGIEDAYVAQMKGQILCLCPQATIVDITHAVPPQDIAAGALLLSQAVPFFPADTVHVAVVDPGVGTERPLLAVEYLTQADAHLPALRQRLVLPDNGLITLLEQQHTRLSARYLANSATWRSGVSATFHGRDIMGPVAARWAAGMPSSEFGPPCESPQVFRWPAPEFRGNSIVGQPILLDHFGNVITNIHGQSVLSSVKVGQVISVAANDRQIDVPFVETYGQCAAGQVVALVGSHGYLELARVNGHAADHLGIDRQTQLRLTWTATDS